MSRTRLRVVLTGGGTGGHVYPLLALAEEAGPEAEILFCGGGNGLESRLVERAGLPFIALPSAAILGRGPTQRLRAGARLVAGVSRALQILRRFRPHLVVSTGGYAGYPVGQAAAILRRPLVVIEPNARPGLATTLLGRFAAAVCTGFPHTVGALGPRAVWTGTPLRRALRSGDRDRAVARFGLEPHRRTVLVLGGSQGAASLNRATAEVVRALEERDDLQILHQTGTRRASLPDLPSPRSLRYVRVDYLEDIADAYAAADLVVSRAGAVTCAELAALGLAAILVPLPIAGGHQLDNARALEQAGAAVVVPDRELHGPMLARLIQDLFEDPARVERMREAARSLGRPDAAAAAWRVCVATVGRTS